MIGSVAIQRLLEAAILLKLERGTRGSETRSSAPKQTTPNIATKQAGPPPQTPRGAHFTQASTWNNAPLIPADAPIAVAQAVREAAVAPLAYRETVSDAAASGARASDPIPANAVPAPIQYAHPELALALSRTKAGAPVLGETSAALAASLGASLNQKEERALAHQAKLIALIAGSAGITATLAILIFS